MVRSDEYHCAGKKSTNQPLFKNVFQVRKYLMPAQACVWNSYAAFPSLYMSDTCQYCCTGKWQVKAKRTYVLQSRYLPIKLSVEIINPRYLPIKDSIDVRLDRDSNDGYKSCRGLRIYSQALLWNSASCRRRVQALPSLSDLSRSVL